MGRNRTENNVNKVCAALCLGIAAMSSGWPTRLLSAEGPTATAPCRRPAEGVPSYLPAAPFDAPALIGPTPAADSTAQRADLQAVLHAQRVAHARHTTARALADVELSCARITNAVAEFHGQPEAEAPLAFLNRAARQAATLTGVAKRYWQRPRPYLASHRVERLGDVAVGAALPENPAGDAAYRQLRDHSGYPSGHAGFGQVCTILLARMVPERRGEIFERSLSYSESRLILGAHYPSDVAAGRSLGTATAALLFANPCFEEDFSSARAALRHALGLPD